MKHRILLKLFGCCMVVLVPLFANTQTPSNDNNWLKNDLESDEFNDTSYDPSKWVFWPGPESHGISIFRSNELKFEQEGKRRYLKLEGRAENGIFYTAGLRDKDNDFGYGYYEIYSRVDQTKGFWPAFWLWSDPVCWREEIDIFEPSGCQIVNGDHKVTIHKKENDICSNPNEPVYVIRENTNFSNWHKYAIEWLPNKLVFYYDDVPFWDAPIEAVQEVSDNQDKVLWIELQISDGACHPEITNGYMGSWDVDYFRYYELKSNCTAIGVSSTDPDFFNTFNYEVRKSFVLGNMVFPNNSKKTLRARDSFQFNSGFIVPAGSEFTAIISPCTDEKSIINNKKE